MTTNPALGVCYYPEHWPPEMWRDDARCMIEAGISWVRIGEFAWSRLEPREGHFDWDWLDQAFESLAGLKIILGTPSATPPKWVLNKYPDMLALDKFGRPRGFGSRRHYCFSHIGYRHEAARMAAAMAERYANHPSLKAWQIDNEYGCHATTISYSAAARAGFRLWLQKKYSSIEALNRSWGNVFWSMEYPCFEDIDLPHFTVTEANPSHCLDFRRFTSQQVVAFNQNQVEAIRAHSDRPLIHNYMGRITDFDHFRVGEDLDIASWDSYPLGFLEQVLSEEDEDWKARFAEQGDPDFQAFHHDLYRAVGRGRLWVMEQQPGPVNWAVFNPCPLAGMVKLWTMEAIAHGAEVVSYFRWRQAPFAQEQMHAGLLYPDNTPAPGLEEVKEIAQELPAITPNTIQQADVGLVFDYESQWAWEVQPQGQSFDYFRVVFEMYRALRRLGLNVDFLPASSSSFTGYRLILIPALMSWNANLTRAIEAFQGIVLAGPRTGLKTPDMQIPETMGPDFAHTTSRRVASLRPHAKIALQKAGKIHHWFEHLEAPAANIFLQTADKRPVVTRHQNHFYLGSWLDAEAMLSLLKKLCLEADIATHELEEGVRRRKTQNHELIINYNPYPVTVQGESLAAGGYCWRSL